MRIPQQFPLANLTYLLPFVLSLGLCFLGASNRRQHGLIFGKSGRHC